MNPHDTENKGGKAKLRSFLTKERRRIALLLIDIGCFLAAYLFNAIFQSISHETPMERWLPLWPNALILLSFIMTGRFLSKVYHNVWRYPNVRAYVTMVVADMSCGGLAFLLTYALSHMGVPNLYINFWQTFCVLALFALGTLVMRFGYQLAHQTRHKGERVNGEIGKMSKIGIAIVGAGQVGCHLAEELRTNPMAH